MKYIDYIQLNPIERFWYKFKEFFRNLPNALKAFFCAIGKAIKKFVLGVGNGIKDFALGFVQGDIITKLSYLIMGLGNATRGQVIKGIIFFSLEVAYIAFMVCFGGMYLGQFFHLEAATHYETISGGRGGTSQKLVYDTYSNQILLYGILAIMATLAFVAVYIASTKSARRCELLKKEGKKPETFISEVKEFLDSKFHITLLSVPVILICVFVLLPLIFMILMAFTNYDDKNYFSFQWVGMANFGEIFSSNSGGASMGYTFGNIVLWTLIWAVAATFSNYILGMVVALMINKKGIKLKKLWRTLFVMTIAVPQFVTLLLVSQMIGRSQDSPLNLIISMFTGAPSQFNVLAPLYDGWIARAAVIIINIWIGIPYTILMTTGILMNIPEDLYESARIDGAGPVKSFTAITLPYMLFVTTPHLITNFIGNVNNFNVIFLLTGGGPSMGDYAYGAGKTDLLITLLYRLSVDKQKYGLGAAIGILVFIVCATLSLITFNMTKSAKDEEAFS